MTLDDLQANRKLMVEKVRKQRSDIQMMGGPSGMQQIPNLMSPVSVETNVARDPRRAAGMRHGMGTGGHGGQASAPLGNFSKSMNVRIILNLSVCIDIWHGCSNKHVTYTVNLSMQVI